MSETNGESKISKMKSRDEFIIHTSNLTFSQVSGFFATDECSY